mgnify:CR=1 FL=1
MLKSLSGALAHTDQTTAYLAAGALATLLDGTPKAQQKVHHSVR